MNGAQAHLLVNHLPIVSAFLGVLALGVGAAFRGAAGKAFARAGLVLLVVAAAGTPPAYFSGEGAEELIEDRPGVSEDTIHDHEEAAELASVLIVLAGVGAAGTLWVRRKGGDSWRHAERVVLLAGVVGFAAIARAGHLGGLIRHPELSGQAGPSHAPDGAAAH